MRVQRRDPAAIWGRRIVAVPAFMLATVVAVIVLPVALLVALVLDVLRHHRLVATRVVLLVIPAMVVESGGLIAAFVVWVITGVGIMRSAFLRLSSALQIAWAALLFRMAMRIFRVRIEIEGPEALTPGPILIFMRHTSVADTLSPAELIARPAGLTLRYVMKWELLWSPGINVMGTRTPNCFVRRGSGGESRFVGMLADDLGPRDGVLIYPEGMVVTPAKAAAMGNDTGRARSKGYERVHPPRLGGPLALLERAGGHDDIVFAGHVGFEVAPGVRQLLRGDLLDARVRFRFWRVPAAEVPGTRQGMADWLQERWRDMDAWVARTQDEMGVRSATT